jgi:prophage antirepressor-like protein
MKLETFDFNTVPVRVLLRDEQPWFVAADVCRVLEIQNPSDAIKSLDEDESITLDNADGNPRAGIAHKLRLISESGLYTLIFKSRKAEAKKFRKWVTAEVLPAIRRTGGYALPVGNSASEGLELMSVLAFVRDCCAGWPLERQMAYGMMVRRYAKSMGVIFQTVEEPGVGRVFAFARPVLEAVRGTLAPMSGVLVNPEGQEMTALLRALHEQHGDTVMAAEEVRREAVRLGFFPRLLNLKSEMARSSAFGCLVARYAGQILAGGYVIENQRTSARRFYAIRRETAVALAA